VNTTKHTEVNRRRTLIATVAALILVVASAMPFRPEGAAAAQLEADKELPRSLISAQRDSPRTDARPREAEVAKVQVAIARAGAKQKVVPDQVSVLTLGGVLFTSGRADFKPGGKGNLHRLVDFLDKYPDRRVAILGYTDSHGSEEYNQGLSERRANSVKAYLAAQGIDSTRLCASGMGQSAPVAGNDSGAGRQQNRRVEVIISNPPVALTQRTQTAKMIVLLALLESVGGSSGRPLP
jgi:outer membrane protein OmpA-like peptidoglycan-associated protein